MAAAGDLLERKEIPGGYGLPFIGPLMDRLNLYWLQGDVAFFQERIKRYKSTVFRVNFAPGPPGYANPRGIALLDHKAFQVMLDNDKVDKRDTFFGPSMPSLSFTGGYRTLPYLSTTEEKHALYKDFLMDLIRLKYSTMSTEYARSFAQVATSWESELKKSGKAELKDSSGVLIINFLLRCFTGHPDPAAAIGESPHSAFQRWAFVQFAFVVTGILPHFVEELTYHSFPLPYSLAKKQHMKLCKFFRENAGEALDLAETKYGLDREETVHQLVTCLGVNARTGLMKKIPVMVYYLGKLGQEFQAKLAKEVRGVIKDDKVTFESLQQMPLLRSTVLEAFRLMPSTFFVYGRAREDLVIESGDSSKFLVKKGELMGAHWYFVLRDPAVFGDPQNFVPERFMGEQGKALMSKLVWSNGRQDEEPSPSNKQCPGKDMAVLLTCQFVAEMFLRYDSFEVTSESFINTTAQEVFFKSLKKRQS